MNRMLIVDDDWMITDGLKHMEEWDEMNIDIVGVAANGEEALLWLQSESIDIVLTDIVMPIMDGITLIKHIHEKKQTPKVIIMSGFDEFAYAQTAINYNVSRYLLKPVDTDELIEAIQMVQHELEISNKHYVENAYVEKSQSQQERIITHTLNYIHTNYMLQINLTLLANKVHISEQYLGQLFKSITGTSFIEYITDYRLEQAKKLLGNLSLRVYEISSKVGYSDSKYFTKVFKKKYGLTPSQYRNKYFKTD